MNQHQDAQGHTDSPDPLFGEPYTDVDECRTSPVPHRYLHGGFTGTDNRFSAYFPPAEQYQGRFFQHVTPVPQSEHLAQTAHGQEDRIGFAVASGGYFLETNGGGENYGSPGSDADPTIAAYRANAACARYSRELAAHVYGRAHRPYGYLYGGSGGAYRTIGAAENTEGVWDGFVPYVIGSPMAIPNVFSVRMHAQRVLRERLDDIADAVEPGGGDIYAGLDTEQRAALDEVTRMGFPPRAWFGHRTMGSQAFSVLYTSVVALDPGYFENFWTEPGHHGADSAPDGSVHRARVRHRCTVAELVTPARTAPADGPADGGVDNSFASSTGTPTALRLSEPAPTDTMGAQLTVRSGALAGRTFALREVRGDLATLDQQRPGVTLEGLWHGDEIEVDNSNFLAAQTYHRHQVPGPEYTAWDQFRAPDGTPLHPQRPVLAGPLFTSSAAGTLPTGRFSGRMIAVCCLLDREAFPWQGDWYRNQVRTHLGADGEAANFRLWYVDHALHGDIETQEDPTHTVSYLGVLHQALWDLAHWVEDGVEPAASTDYTVQDGQVQVPADAEKRQGVQPVAVLTADGRERARATAGQEVLLRAEITCPPGGGSVVAAAWDLDGTGAFAMPETIDPAPRVALERRHVFTEPGIHFVTFRASAHREATPGTAFGRLDTLARARVIVVA
ncbi:Tat pathway signal sequence domain protein [Streptomyces sp. NPDC005373]|uniref:Tat pathway signal sequence domain protein n=1 Tax=Streptomyces sp. NPDC005373 TaxID=3156879 RepID=UPI0033A734E5